MARKDFPGVGERIKKRLVELGYEKEKKPGEPDLARFLREKGYDPRYFYGWANAGIAPMGENLARLAQDLQVSRGWLLLGDEELGHEDRSGPAPAKKVPRRPVPIRGGSAARAVKPAEADPHSASSAPPPKLPGDVAPISQVADFAKVDSKHYVKYALPVNRPAYSPLRWAA